MHFLDALIAIAIVTILDTRVTASIAVDDQLAIGWARSQSYLCRNIVHTSALHQRQRLADATAIVPRPNLAFGGHGKGLA